MDPVLTTALRLGDNALVLGQRLGHWVSRSPTVELDVAFANQALDLIGQANLFYDLAGRLEGKGRSADDLAYLRDPHEFFNVQLVEQPNGDFSQTMMRQVMYATWAHIVFEFMARGKNGDLAAIAAKAEKEMAYHVRHAGEWMIRLGDGTSESHERSQAALDFMWPWTHELFAYDDVDEAMVAAGVLPDSETLKTQWSESLDEVFQRGGLTVNDDGWRPGGGRQGIHSEHLSYLLEEMQVLPRSHPGAQW
ncbi:1,2-phenylacetyl-CoA epoxidase, subunit C [hydrothermal vent metagenome]|uniref:1,2-phenylacetyl-CoA epoxidase, subunit C n=1 Tax=hydrothermal vent metagenome TaxID=652676 RepID=A0A3B0R1M9_9ZZZZ